jgi:DNA polymerase lambda
VDDYIINIDETCIKKKPRNIISSQSNNINVEQLKKELNISTDFNNDMSKNKINKNLSQEEIYNNNMSLNSSQNSNIIFKDNNHNHYLSSYSSSSLISDNFEFENDLNLNDLTNEELFDKIKDQIINKNNSNDSTNREIEIKEIPNSINNINISKNTFKTNNSDKDELPNYKFSESQETKPSSNFFDNININNKPKSKPLSNKKKKIRRIKSNYFAFDMGKSKTDINKNSHLTNEFEKILEFHENEGNKFEALAYRKVISILKRYKDEINDPNKIPKIKGIGPKITEKIKEILITGKCRKSDNVSNDTKNKCIKELIKVHGIGIKQANEFYTQGIKSIYDLKKISDSLPSTIQKGLKYYDDIQIKIPREEISELFKKIEEELYKILDKKFLKTEVVGSYRRGKELCGDMDLIITRIDDGKISGILHTLVDRLTVKKIIIDTLSMSDNDDNNYQVFMGICKLNNNSLHRRLDIKVYEKSFYPFAILYFTGSAYFNRSLRLFAKKKGYHLSDKELSNRFNGVKIPCNSEEDIFKALDLKYKTPEERDI